MAEQLLDRVRDVVEGQIDFEGQKLADKLATFLLCAAAVASFGVGYVRQDIVLAVYIALAGTALTALVVVPPWPFFNQHPVQWLPVGGGGNHSIDAPQTQTVVLDEKLAR